LSTQRYRNLTLFDADDEGRLFLERQAGLAEANRLMNSEIAIWRWRARWYRPPDKEELRVWLSPAGRVVGFTRLLRETAPGEKITQERARQIASEFLKSHSSLPHKLVEETKEQHPNREDHTFTWEQEGFRLADATYNRTITVAGSEVSHYMEYLELPDKWNREYAAMRSKNELYTNIAQAFYVPLFLVAVVVLVRGLRSKNIRWTPLTAIALVVGGSMTLNQWNSIPFTLDRMPTSSTITTSFGIAVLQALGAGAAIFFYVLVAAAPGETLYRRVLRSKLAMSSLFSMRGLGSREFFWSCLAGYGFAAAHMVFLVAFYLMGSKLGFWNPQDVTHSDLLSTPLPWLFPLSVSLLASFSEEFWFRLMAIPLLKIWTRSWVIAIVVPAMVWGFLHANYPQQPAWVRGVEVGMIGIGAGVLMLRYGLMSTLVWHYTIDAALIGTFLFASASWYLRVSGFVVAAIGLVPLAVCAHLYRRNGGFVDRAEDLNQAVPEPAPVVSHGAAEEAEAAPGLAPVWPRAWLWAAGALLLAAGYLVQTVPFGGDLKVAVDREEALRAAGAPPAGWMSSADYVLNLNTPTLEYLRQQVGSGEAGRLVQKFSPVGVWRVRWFQPGSAEVWYRFADQKGRVFRVDHDVDDMAGGGHLALEEAAGIAGKYIREQQGMNPAALTLVDASSEKLDNRTDHTFEWEDPAFKAGEAKARILLVIQGSEPTRFRRFIKLPEEWERQYSSQRLQAFLLPALGGGLMLTALFALFRRLSSGWLNPRWYAAVALAAFVLAVTDQWNAAPVSLMSYDTAKPFSEYVSEFWVTGFVRGLLFAMLAGIGALAVDLFAQITLGTAGLPRPSWRNCLAVAGAAGGLATVLRAVGERVPGERLSLSVWSIVGVDNRIPAADLLTSAATFALFGAMAAGLVILSGSLLLSRSARWTYGALAAVAIGLSRSIGVPGFVFETVSAGFMLLLLLFVVRTAGADLYSMAGALFLVRLAPAAINMIQQPSPTVKAQGVIALVAGVVLLGALFFWLSRRRSGSSIHPAPLPGSAS